MRINCPHRHAAHSTASIRGNKQSTARNRVLAATNVRATNESGTWFIHSPKAYIAPDRVPQNDGVVVVRDGNIVAVGEKSTVAIPDGARESTFSDGVITVGFQNSNVHFIGDA